MYKMEIKDSSGNKNTKTIENNEMHKLVYELTVLQYQDNDLVTVRNSSNEKIVLDTFNTRLKVFCEMLEKVKTGSIVLSDIKSQSTVIISPIN